MEGSKTDTRAARAGVPRDLPLPPVKLPETAGDAGILPNAARAIARAIDAWSPASLSAFSRHSYRLEFVNVAFFAVPLAFVDGSIASVITKKSFAGVADPASLYYAVALVQAAPELANILSFFWSQLQHGHGKVAFINAMQAAVLILVGILALIPRTPTGLWLLVATIVLARVFWSGIVTVRPTIWRANYPREVRATVVGKFSAAQVLTLAAIGIVLGRLLDVNPHFYRYVIPLAVLCGIVAFASIRALRVRGHARILAHERATSTGILAPWEGPRVMWRVLRKDRDFASFMLWMFVLGLGNLLIVPVLVFAIAERFKLGYLGGILATSSIPALVMFLSIPLWARWLDRAHVVRFRAFHSWVFVIANIVVLLAVATTSPVLLFLGSVCLGIGFSGGAIAWNIGHVDFAPPAQTSQYMATHVTLNGIRGLIAPFIAATLYSILKHYPLSPGPDGEPRTLGTAAGVVILAGALVISIVGSIGFVRLYRHMGARAHATSRS